MSKYLLDTNVLIDMCRGINGIRGRIVEAGPDNCFVSQISLAELQTGCELTQNMIERTNLEFCRTKFRALPVNDKVLDMFARMKAAQIMSGRKAPDFDLLIAATAKCYNLTVVSHDSRHFALIDGIRFEDWTAVSCL
mgnify:CR=1 FL=1